MARKGRSTIIPLRYILVDAGPLIALFDRDDSYHQLVLDYIKTFNGKLITTWPVLTEALHMLGFHVNAQLDLLTWVERNGVQIYEMSSDVIPDIKTYFDKYRNIEADLADISLLVAADQMNVTQILTIDRDFNIYRMPDGEYLHNVLQY
ncbi:hypothetical protein CYPRO_1222 [Cyclonatronum proteinivorum]|uniref:PIN domain-containing protein n=1 Tax=Cyclonatronum proteinivorum TaxID=1457365 RepID=A0A345UJ33_9BACT|nr:PIN domain-containing protein [Cyclonatronum proteinivorum]AXJ00485.1 hypothetical protein CYPRO_1222 [Cyclonatronum proteinivorum]